MARPDIHRDVDLSNSTAKRELMSEVGRFGGLYAVTIKPIRPTRSSQQNRYFHGVICRAFREFMASQGQHFTHEQVYQFLRDRFIPRAPVLDITTGEVIDYMPASTAALDVPAFAEFLTAVLEWMEDTFGIIVPEPIPERSERHQYQTHTALS